MSVFFGRKATLQVPVLCLLMRIWRGVPTYPSCIPRRLLCIQGLPLSTLFKNRAQPVTPPPIPYINIPTRSTRGLAYILVSPLPLFSSFSLPDTSCTSPVLPSPNPTPNIQLLSACLYCSRGSRLPSTIYWALGILFFPKIWNVATG